MFIKHFFSILLLSSLAGLSTNSYAQGSFGRLSICEDNAPVGSWDIVVNCSHSVDGNNVYQSWVTQKMYYRATVILDGSDFVPYQRMVEARSASDGKRIRQYDEGSVYSAGMHYLTTRNLSDPYAYTFNQGQTIFTQSIVAYRSYARPSVGVRVYASMDTY